jgi:uncharacterized protein YjiS (DUF1127 family)
MSVLHPTEWLRSQDSSATLVEHLRLETGPRARLGRAVAAYFKRRRERRELYGMSDRELRDIGITRADIDRVLGPNFVREFAVPSHPHEVALVPHTTKQEITMRNIFAALFAAFLALTGITTTAHAYYDAAPDRTTVSGNAAG